MSYKFEFPHRCRSIAFVITYNADAQIVGCRFSCRYILAMQMNREGKVEFRENEMIENRPNFILDGDSKLTFNDFEAPEIEIKDFGTMDRPHAKGAMLEIVLAGHFVYV